MEVGDGQIQVAVPVEIPHPERNGFRLRVEVLGRLERAVPVPCQAICPPIANRIVVDEVEPNVPVPETPLTVTVYVVPEPVTTTGPARWSPPAPALLQNPPDSHPVTVSLNVTMNRGLAAFAAVGVGSGMIELTVGLAGTVRVSSGSNPRSTCRPRTLRAANTFREIILRNPANQFSSRMLQS